MEERRRVVSLQRRERRRRKELWISGCHERRNLEINASGKGKINPVKERVREEQLFLSKCSFQIDCIVKYVERKRRRRRRRSLDEEKV